MRDENNQIHFILGIYARRADYIELGVVYCDDGAGVLVGYSEIKRFALLGVRQTWGTDMTFTMADFPLRDSDLRNMETFQRVMDSIYANVPAGHEIESIKCNPGENKIFVRMKPMNHFVKVGKMVLETKVE